MKKSIAFIVLTCDKYSDLWPMYVHFFDRNWQDCPYDRFFVSNFKSVEGSTFGNILIGKDESWSEGLLKALNELKANYDYVFISLEDLPITEKIDQSKLDGMIDEFLKCDGNFITFRNYPKPTSTFNADFGVIDKGSLYRPNCAYSLWKIAVLEDLLCREESAWEFERFGSIRSEKYDNFFAVNKDFIKVRNTVIKGKWLRSEYNRVKRFGFTPDLSSRELFSPLEEFHFRLREFVFNVFNRMVPIPWRMRRKLVFKVQGYKYPTVFVNSNIPHP